MIAAGTAAAIAAGVAVAGTAASVAMQATAGGPHLPGQAPMSPAEARAQRAQVDALGAERQYTERGAYEQNLLQPSLYEFAGYTPEYDQASFGEASQARATADQSQRDFENAQATRDQYQGAQFKALRKQRLQGLKGKDRKAALKTLRQEKKSSGRGIKVARKKSETLGETATAAETRAGRITGLKAGRLGTAEEQQFEDVLSKRALDAATTGKSTDPRLNRELDQQEGDIRARLARQFGADYENTTAGQMALSSFRQHKDESLADFSRKDIGYADTALSHRTQLGQIAAQRMTLAEAPVDQRRAQAQSFGELGTRYQNFEEMLQQDRLAANQINVQKSEFKYDAQQHRLDAITGSIGQLSKGAAGFAGTEATAGKKTP